MKKETKKDILTMIYQFIFAGALFWIAVYLKIQPIISGKVISALGNVGATVGLSVWFIITLIFLAVGFLGLYVQRRNHLKLKREKRRNL